MATTNESSFIPKAGSASRGSAYRGGSWLMLGAFGFFVIVLLLSVGVFLYKQYAISARDSAGQELQQAQAAFEPELISELSRLETTIDSASTLLNNHIAVTPLFPIVEEVTLESVQFNSMQVSFPEAADTAQNENGSQAAETNENAAADSSTAPMMANVSMSGTGPGYAAVALQASELAEHDQITNSILSSFELNDTGNVAFDVQFQVPKSVLTYENTI